MSLDDFTYESQLKNLRLVAKKLIEAGHHPAHVLDTPMEILTEILTEEEEVVGNSFDDLGI